MGGPRRPWCATRYLAAELGPNDIRVNSISGGPLKTSMMAGFSSILANIEEHGPLRRNVPVVTRRDRPVLAGYGTGCDGQIIRVD